MEKNGVNSVVEWGRSLFKTGFFHIFGSSVINKIVGFLSSTILVRILSKSEYGVFTYAWNIYNILIIANGMGMASGLIQVCSERTDDLPFSRRAISYGVKTGIAFDVVLATVMLVIGFFVPLKINGANGLLRLLCLLPMFQLVYDLMTAYLRSQKRNQAYAKLTATNTCLILLFTVIGAVFFRETGMVIGYYVAYALSAFQGWRMSRLGWFTQDVVSADEKKLILSIALVSVCSLCLSQILYHLDVLVLGILVADEKVIATYKVATLIPVGLTFIPMSLITYVYPYFAEHRLDRAWCMKKYKLTSLALGAVDLTISLCLFALAPWVIRIMFGKQYLGAVPIFRILMINFFFSGNFRILSANLLTTQRKLKFNLLTSFVSCIVNIAGDILFIRWWGVIGAAYATVSVVFVSGMMSTVYLILILRQKNTTPDIDNSSPI